MLCKRKKRAKFRSKLRARLKSYKRDLKKRIEYCDRLNEENTRMSLQIETICNDREKIQNRCNAEVEIMKEKKDRVFNKNKMLIDDIRKYRERIRELLDVNEELEENVTYCKQMLDIYKSRVKYGGISKKID